MQVVKGSHYRDLAENNRLRRMAVKAPRGTILDRNGRVLVENLPSYNVLLDRSRAASVGASLAFAAPILARPLPELEALLERYRGVPAFQPVLLGEGLALEQVARFRVEELSHPEFVVEVSHRRLYRLGFARRACPGLPGRGARRGGRRDPAENLKAGDWVGRRGIEREYDHRLRGADGEQVVVVDSRGQPVEELGRQVGRPGEDLTLTLDAELQQEAERQLEGKVGAVVALDPRNGEIRALVSSPAYDPNLFARRLAADDWQKLLDDPFRPLQNRALQSAYPPGSIFKVVVAAAGLAEGVVSLTDGVYCNGAKSFYKRPFPLLEGGRPRLGEPRVGAQELLRHLLLRARPEARRRADRALRAPLRPRGGDRHRSRRRAVRSGARPGVEPAGAAPAGIRARRSRSRSARGHS